MSVIQGSSWTCRFCSNTFNSPTDLCAHVSCNKFRAVLTKSAPKCRTEVGRLHSFVATYLSEEPILGLEYVEEKTMAFSVYMYICMLCNKRGGMHPMFGHVISIKHAKLFLEKHHPMLAPRRESFCNRQAYIQALITAAAEVHKTPRIQSVTQHKAVTGGDGKNGNAVSVKRLDSEESEEQNPSKRQKVMDSEIVAKHLGESVEILQYLQKFTNCDRFCSLCSVSCPTMVELYQHITGVVHAVNLGSLAPEEMKESTRLCNLLDTYMKGEPILGLGFIAEKEADTMYVYTCLLCDAQENWPHIFTHLLTVDHMARYIEKYHNVLFPKPKNFCNREAFVKAILASAIRVYKNLGDVSVPEAASEDDGEEENPSPLAINVVQNNLPCPVEKMPLDFPEAELHKREHELEALGISSVRKRFCRVCRMCFSKAVELCKHLMTASHKLKLGDAPPEVLQRMSSLSYYLDTLLKDEPFVGLEYLVENKFPSFVLYRCTLCNLQYYSNKMLQHISSGKHIAQYITEHCKNHKNFPIDVPNRVLEKYASRICRLHGRKEMKHVLKDTCSPEDTKVDDLPLEHDVQNCSAITRRKVVREVISRSTGNCQTLKIEVENAHESQTCNISDSASDNKKNDTLPVRKDTLPLTCTSKETELDDQVEFKTNKDFLDYLSTFKIRDEKDAAIIKQISQNCSNALRRFLEEEAEEEMERRQQHWNELQTYGAHT